MKKKPSANNAPAMNANVVTTAIIRKNTATIPATRIKIPVKTAIIAITVVLVRIAVISIVHAMKIRTINNLVTTATTATTAMRGIIVTTAITVALAILAVMTKRASKMANTPKAIHKDKRGKMRKRVNKTNALPVRIAKIVPINAVHGPPVLLV